MTSDAQKKASKKWAAKKSNVAIRLDPDFKKKIDEHISKRSERLSEFIIRSVTEQMLRDDEQSAETDENGGS